MGWGGGGWGGVGVGGLIWVSTLRMLVAARTVPSSSDDVNVDVPWRDNDEPITAREHVK